VGSEDVFISLNRILQKDENTHGSLRLLLCGTSPASKDCSKISVKDNRIIITPHKDVAKEFLIYTLATIDFAIIPKVALDLTDKDLPCLSFPH
jgi:hypothetical protein